MRAKITVNAGKKKKKTGSGAEKANAVTARKESIRTIVLVRDGKAGLDKLHSMTGT